MTCSDPTRLMICQSLGDERRLTIEVEPDDRITVTCWNGARQVSQPVQIALAKAPRMAVLVETVRRALAQQQHDQCTAFAAGNFNIADSQPSL